MLTKIKNIINNHIKLYLYESLIENELNQNYNVKVKLNLKDKIFNLIIKTGFFGGIIIYIVMVSKNNIIELPVYKKTAIIDIKNIFILRKKYIKKEYRSLKLKRKHLPLISIINEIKDLYEIYYRLKKIENINKYLINENKKNNEEIIYSLIINKHKAIKNEYYLLRMIYFFIHRSIILANSKIISENIKSLVVVNEFTSQVMGYISAFEDLKIKNTLYMATRNPETEFKYISLNMFNKIIVKYGSFADKIEKNYQGKLVIERNEIEYIKNIENKKLNIGVFLASFYHLNYKQCNDFGSKNIIPFINELNSRLDVDKLIVHLHPNDRRLSELLLRNKININISNDQPEDRMNEYDFIYCGNTTAVEEALIFGKPVIYNGKLDNYKYDLFGYVKSFIALDDTLISKNINQINDFYKINKDNLNEYFNGKKKYNKVLLHEEI